MKWRNTILLAGALATAVPALAQQTPHDRRQDRQQARRDEMFKMVDAYLAMNIEDKLGLSNEQFTRVLPLVRRASADKRRFAERRTDLLRDIRERLESGGATEAQVGQSLKELKALEEEEPATLRRDREAIDQTLTVVQQAKLRVLQLEVERRIRALMQGRGQGVGPEGRPPAAPGPPE
jgi:hypothetical protein